jgi:aminopeptidase N
MKKMYILFLFVTTLVKAQVPTSPGQSGSQYQPDIAVYERHARKYFLDAQGTEGVAAFTTASHNFDVNYYRCNWKLNPEVQYINGDITSYFTIKAASDSIVYDLVSSLIVDSVVYHGNKITFHQSTDNALVIKWPSTLNAGQKDSVSIFYQGIPVSYGFGRFWQGIHRGNHAIWTLSEPYGAAGWWPCKNGLNDKSDSLDIIVTIPDAYTASSNGVLVGQVSNGGNNTSHFKHRYPIATYLIALAIGKYNPVAKDSVLIGGRQMPVLMYSLIVTNPAAYLPATAQVKKCIVKFSELFGLYPFYKEHYCQTQWGVGGGMEHQTNSFIVDRWPNLVAHELGHQWFGDKVTCGSWQDLWLNEGFATFTEFVYYENFEASLYKPNLVNIINNVTSIPDGSVWVPDTTNFTRLFSSRLTYRKGGMVLHMLRWMLGDSVFFKGVRSYLEDPAVTYGYARTADLKRILENVSGRNLENFFNKWIYGEGYPSYQLTWNQNINHWAKIKLNQTTSHGSVSFYDMPVAIQFKNASRDTILVLDHRYSGQEFSINVGFEADSVFIDPELKLLSKNNTVAKELGNENKNQLKIYPNPSPERLFISLNNPTDKKLSLRLFNSIGQLVYRKEIDTPGHDEMLDIPMQHLARGIYYLKLKSEKNINMTRKIMR